jgi:hypothetical protein
MLPWAFPSIRNSLRAAVFRHKKKTVTTTRFRFEYPPRRFLLGAISSRKPAMQFAQKQVSFPLSNITWVATKLYYIIYQMEKKRQRWKTAQPSSHQSDVNCNIHSEWINYLRLNEEQSIRHLLMLRLYEEQSIRHLLMSQAVWGTVHSPFSHVSGCTKNRAFAIFLCLKLQKEQSIRHLLMSQAA